jgi:hypothetical protein
VIQKVTSSNGRTAGHVASTQKGTSSLKGATTNKKKQAHSHYQRTAGTFGYALTNWDQNYVMLASNNCSLQNVELLNGTVLYFAA